MSSYSSASSAPDEDGWTRVGSHFRGDAAAAFSRPPRRTAARAEFSEDASAAFGRPTPSRRPAASGFGEDAASAFGRRPPRAEGEGRRPSARAEFDEAAASAFGGGGGGSRRAGGFGEDASNVFGGSKKPREGIPYTSRYSSATAPVKKQTFDEAFPVLGGGGASTLPAPIPVEERAPTLAEKLRKKVAEEAAEDERRAKAAEEAAARRAADARERAIFARLGASRMASTQVRHSDYEDDVPANYDNDLECGAFGESTEVGAYIPSKYTHDYEGYGEGEDD